MIMINHIKEEFDKHPEMIHTTFLNNTKYSNFNFVHPNFLT